MERAAEISMPVAKASSAITVAAVAQSDVAGQVMPAAVRSAPPETWGIVNSIPWGNVASMVAAAYTLLLISEWFWKKLLRPFSESRGWIKPKKPRIMTVEEYNAYLRDTDADRQDTESGRL